MAFATRLSLNLWIYYSDFRARELLMNITKSATLIAEQVLEFSENYSDLVNEHGVALVAVSSLERLWFSSDTELS